MRLLDLLKAATVSEKLTMAFCTLYVFSPIDFIPEILFGFFGVVDDATAIGLIIWTLRGIKKRMDEKNAKSSKETLPAKKTTNITN